MISKFLGFNLRVLAISAGMAGFIGYCFIIMTLLKTGSLKLPLSFSQPSQNQVVVAPAEPTCFKPAVAWTCDFSNFPAGALSNRDWNFEIGNKVADYNKELQTYTSRPENARVENGVLVIDAHPEDINNRKYSSARINTKDKFDFTYGTLEVDLMLPRGVGTWPAVWLLPAQDQFKPTDYGIKPDDPTRWALNGEIDFVETIGSIPGKNLPAVHSYNELHETRHLLANGTITNPYTEYHRYGIIKAPGKITFTIDGVPFASHQKTSDSPLDWPYDQSYYLIMNLAIGGYWEGVNGVDQSLAPWQMKVRSISYRPL